MDLEVREASLIEGVDAAEVLRGENKRLQALLDQALSSNASMEARLSEAEEGVQASVKSAVQLAEAHEHIRELEEKRFHLEGCLEDAKTRLSDGVRDRASLSRRLAESAAEVEEV
ncbi:unnamed protein product, partial [Choristocarpus tenellus]